MLSFLKRNPNGPGAAEWLPRLPMAKAGMQAMRAAEEFTKSIKVTTETPGVLSVWQTTPLHFNDSLALIRD